MLDCSFKMIILYFILMTMLFIVNPPKFYYDNAKTRLKPISLYMHTQKPHDLISFYSSSIIIAIFVFIVIKSIKDD